VQPYVRFGVGAAEAKTLPSTPKLMSLALGTTQRRSPLAHEKSDGAAAAPRERSVFTTSEDVGFKPPSLFRIRPHNAAVQRPRTAV
jgi:hypothetical protein